MTTNDELMHYGMPRRSGRYPWGSGENGARQFRGKVKELRSQGMTESDIAKGFGISVNKLRQEISRAKDEISADNVAQTIRLKEKGWSNIAIAERLGTNESTVRGWLKAKESAAATKTAEVVDMLKRQVDDKEMLDVGTGTELFMGISREKLNNALAQLKADGYSVHYVNSTQLGTGKITKNIVLTKNTVDWSTVNKNKDKIRLVDEYIDSSSSKAVKIQPPVKVDPSRVHIKYAEDGGTDMDGVIQLRRGVADTDLGNARYAQVRIAVGKNRYMKGMAVYTDDLPDGVDFIYNTNKKKGTPADDVFKETADDPLNPFGAQFRQRTFVNSSGKEQLSAINIIREEGEWNTWAKTLSAQMLSKQSPALAQRQLDTAYANRKADLDEILALTNPTVKKVLLQSFADDADAAAVHLKAASMPRQSTKVLIPLPNSKENEVYAPTYKDGERIVLIRYPHGGTFEIPELIVNNKNAAGRRIMGSNASDAIGIHPKVAEKLSGADFDGDTVLAIPNKPGTKYSIKSKNPLKQLENFDNKALYPLPAGKERISKQNLQSEMGKISNLITDMSIKGASDDKIARAVRHSMVVIDSYKHKLDYKQSYIDHDIAALKKEYQGGENRGAATIVSRASSTKYIPGVVDKVTIDPKTGKLITTYKESTFQKVDKKTGEVKTVQRMTKTSKMADTDDARTLSSGTKMEEVYADYANNVKSLANTARKSLVNTPPLKYSKTAAVAYKAEVESLNTKLTVALKNAPRERQAQLIANAVVQAKVNANPSLKDDGDKLKKIKGQELTNARQRVGAAKVNVDIEPREWEAIQAGAISDTKLRKILTNTNTEVVRSYATPKNKVGLSSAKELRAKTLLMNGHTLSDVAEALGVSVDTITKLNNE